MPKNKTKAESTRAQDGDFKTCFVLMPFKAPFDDYFQRIIKPAVESCGLFAVRGDSLFRSTSIMDEVWTGIQKATILIAELTERNPNVFYELGLAHAISKPVVLISESIEDVPFDLRAIRVILYDKNHPEWGAKLRKSIARSLQEVMADPIESIPGTFKTPVHSKAPEESEILHRLGKLEQQIQGLQSASTIYKPRDFGPPAMTRSRDLKAGERVSHKKFGGGVVLNVEGKGASQRIQINFDRAGVKWMLAPYVIADGDL